MHKKNKYHRIDRTYRDEKHVTSEAWFDTDGQPMTTGDTFARIERDFDGNGNTTAERYYGTDGQPVARNDGYDEVRNTFDEINRVIRIEYLADGKPVLTVSGGMAVIERVYGEDGFIATEAYYGTDGEPVAHVKNKYHRIDRTYLDAKHITSEAWYDTDGNAMTTGDTFVRIERDFDERGNTTAER